MSGFKTLLFEKRERIGYVTLNRPEALNVYNIQMRDDLCEVLGAIEKDEDLRVIILKGAGEKAFCAGADLSEFLTAPPPVAARQARFARDIWGLFLRIPHPMIAALHGYVLGSGVEIALCCDIRIASEDVRFGLPEMQLGIIPAAGGTQTLPRTIGYGRALEMLLNNRWLDAEEAHRIKLVNRVVAKERLLETAERMAEEIASYSTESIRCAKQAIEMGLDMSLHEGLYLEKTLASRLQDPGPINERRMN